MLFSSMIFLWIFLPIVLILNYAIYRLAGNKGSNILLFIASLIFYAWGEPVYVFLMIVSIAINWLLGIIIGKSKKLLTKKLTLIIAIIINLSALCYFKYLSMIIAFVFSTTGIDIGGHERNLLLPIGISFYTFQAISYIIDVYRNDCNFQRNPLYLGLYISFFPQLIAGPILRYKDIEHQLFDRRLSLAKTEEGIRRFIYGLGKKVLIANILAYAVDSLYSIDILQITGKMAWVASFLYTFQIYYDFSGYSDMAIGLGKIFGFEFSENFIYPYTSLSIREFWRRWHVSLSSWFKEYVYIPLGGNRCGKRLTYENLLIVFFLTGLWHGASVSFIFWGLFHGAFSILERLGLGNLLKKHSIIAWLYTFLVVNFGWVFFRVNDIGNALRYIKRMFLPWHYTESTILLSEILNIHVLIIAVVSILGAGLLQKMLGQTVMKAKWRGSVCEYFYLISIFLLCIMSLASNIYNPFIYFRF